MDGSASSGGFSGGGLPPRPTVSTMRRRPFVAPHSRAATSSSLDANLPRRQELPSPGSDDSGSRMPSPSGGRSGGRMPFPSGGLPRRLPNAPPTRPRALSFTEPHAATWDAGRITTSPAEVYQVAGDDFSPNHWTPDYTGICGNYIFKEKQTIWLKKHDICRSAPCPCQSGSSRTGQGMNSASKFPSTCFECIASMLSTTKSKFHSSATSPMIAVGFCPSPRRSINLNSENPPAQKQWISTLQ